VLVVLQYLAATLFSFLRFLPAMPLGDDADRAGVPAELEQLHFRAAVVRAEPEVRDQHHGAAAVRHHGLRRLPRAGRRAVRPLERRAPPRAQRRA